MAMTRETYDRLEQQRLQHQSVAKSGYRAVLTPHFEKTDSMTAEQLAKVDRDNEPIEFDVLTDVSISASSNVSSYPIVNGDTVADNMIRQPVSVTLGGTYSMHGNRPTVFSGESDRLTNIETFFERLKDEAVMCSLVTIDRGTDSKQRFKARNNLVLTSITWTEHQASLTFSFTFTEVLTVEVESLEADYTDENLPDITDAMALDFTDTLLDWNAVNKIVLYQLNSVGILKDDFWTWTVGNIKSIASTYGDFVVGGLAGGLTGLAAGIGILVATVSICGAIPIAGWIAAGVIAAVGTIAGAIWALVKSIKRHKAEKDYAVEQFKLYEDDKKNQQEVVKLANYVGNVHQQLEYLENVLKVFGITSNSAQECMLYIDDNYYIFKFEKDNTQTTKDKVVWTCRYQDAEEKLEEKHISDVASSALSEISQCTSTNYLLRTSGSGYYVYLINKSLFAVQNATYSSDKERQKAIQDCNNDLTNFCLFVSTINMDDFNNTLKDIVINAMKR